MCLLGCMLRKRYKDRKSRECKRLSMMTAGQTRTQSVGNQTPSHDSTAKNAANPGDVMIYESLKQFLSVIRLEAYTGTFIEHGFLSMDDLGNIEFEDLIAMKIRIIHSRRMVQAMKEYNAQKQRKQQEAPADKEAVVNKESSTYVMTVSLKTDDGHSSLVHDDDEKAVEASGKKTETFESSIISSIKSASSIERRIAKETLEIETELQDKKIDMVQAEHAHQVQQQESV